MYTKKAVEFFLAHAGYSYDPKTETAEAGKLRCAQSLASAENSARSDGWRFRWETDGRTNREWTDEGAEYATWACCAYDGKGNHRGSLSGIDLGPDGQPHSDPYGRVIEAELALEHFDCVSA